VTVTLGGRQAAARAAGLQHRAWPRPGPGPWPRLRPRQPCSDSEALAVTVTVSPPGRDGLPSALGPDWYAGPGPGLARAHGCDYRTTARGSGSPAPTLRQSRSPGRDGLPSALGLARSLMMIDSQAPGTAASAARRPVARRRQGRRWSQWSHSQWHH
jgi:hypothetical protein